MDPTLAETPVPPAERPRGRLPLGRVKGIPLYAHWTFVLLLPVFVFLMARYFTGFGERTAGAQEYFWGAMLAVALFGSVLLHELGHSLTALRMGLKVRSITLLPIGGVSAFDHMPTKPKEEFLVTAAGPAVNFIIGIPLLAAWYAGLIPRAAGLWDEFLYWTAILNLSLGIFNLLLPAFPMDGGRILRSALASRMGLRRGTEVAASVGRVMAFAMGLWGAFTLASGGWLLLLIAFFIFNGATAEEAGVRLRDTLGNLHVGDLMTRTVDTIPETASVEEAFHVMLRTKHLVLPLKDAAGNYTGYVHLNDLSRVPTPEHAWRPVADVAKREVFTAHESDPATAALETINRAGGEPLLVMEGHTLLGILTKTDLLRAVQILEAEHGGGRRFRGARGRATG
ncbi:MAG TPA: site-2 protease family protein [Candidatus Thermoplasmatota archaeon]|nr:site-2 protease family protein [Candidatus Thermoplasmatota archaeon]